MHLASTRNARTGEPLSASTVHSTLAALKGFFAWLAHQRGYRSQINLTDVEYFNVPDNLSRVASARRYKACPTIQQVRAMLNAMPASNEIERRDRALVAFALLSGARDRAIVSFRLKHIDLENELIQQDARDVRTKRAKTFTTWFFPVGDDVREIVGGGLAYRALFDLFAAMCPCASMNRAGAFSSASRSPHHNPQRKVLSSK